MPHVNVVPKKGLQPWHHHFSISCFHLFENIMLTPYFVMFEHTIATLQTNNPMLSIAHYIPCLQNVQSEKLGHVFSIVLHMFLCGLNLNKTMDYSIYCHKEVGIWRNLKSLNVVTLALCSQPSFETRQIRNEPRTS